MAVGRNKTFPQEFFSKICTRAFFASDFGVGFIVSVVTVILDNDILLANIVIPGDKATGGQRGRGITSIFQRLRFTNLPEQIH